MFRPIGGIAVATLHCMSSKFLLSATALLFGLPGLFLLFAPDVAMASLDGPGGAAAVLMGQLAGGMALALAANNWLARGAAIGGIYGRPLLVADLAASLTCGFALVKVGGPGDTVVPMILGIAFLVLAVAFGRLMFTGPKP